MRTLNVSIASVCFLHCGRILPLLLRTPISRPSSSGGRTHHAASNKAGSMLPEHEELLQRRVRCNSRVAVTRLSQTLCRRPTQHSANKWCASLAPERETQTNDDVCATSISLTDHSTQEHCIMFCPNVKLHVRTLVMKGCRNVGQMH